MTILKDFADKAAILGQQTPREMMDNLIRFAISPYVENSKGAWAMTVHPDSDHPTEVRIGRPGPIAEHEEQDVLTAVCQTVVKGVRSEGEIPVPKSIIVIRCTSIGLFIDDHSRIVSEEDTGHGRGNFSAKGRRYKNPIHKAENAASAAKTIGDIIRLITDRERAARPRPVEAAVA